MKAKQLLLLVSDANEIICKCLDSVDAAVGLDGVRVMSDENSLLSLRNNQAFLTLLMTVRIWLFLREVRAEVCETYLLCPQASVIGPDDCVFLAVHPDTFRLNMSRVLK